MQLLSLLKLVHTESQSQKKERRQSGIFHTQMKVRLLFTTAFAQGPTPLWGEESGRQFVQAALDIFSLLLQPPVTWD